MNQLNDGSLIRHISLLAFLTAALALGIAYPFLKGDYDGLAMPISTMIQVFGVVGLPLVLVGILWLAMPKYRFGFAVASLVAGTLIILLIALFATLSVGKAFGLLVILLWIFLGTILWRKARLLKEGWYIIRWTRTAFIVIRTGFLARCK